MKKVLSTVGILGTLMVVTACGGKSEKVTFTQDQMAGVEMSVVVEHKGDKIEKVTGEAIFENSLLQITDEKTADQVVEAFSSTSGIEDAKMTYDEKKTKITYSVPKSMVDQGSSYKDSEKSLEAAGFKKK